jgi:hypothetical protein
MGSRVGLTVKFRVRLYQEGAKEVKAFCVWRNSFFFDELVALLGSTGASCALIVMNMQLLARQPLLKLAGSLLVACLGLVLVSCGSGKGTPETDPTGSASVTPSTGPGIPLILNAPPSSIFSTSYEYKQDARKLLVPSLNVAALLGQAVTDLDTRNAITFGDFFREGSGQFSAFVMVNSPSGFASAHFFHMESGQWVDRTSLVLKDTVGCQQATFAITADFNSDQRHDVMVTCRGSAASGKESQFLYLSDAKTGIFQKITLHDRSLTPYQFKAYQAAAADLNADGLMDLVLVDPTQAPIVLLANASLLSNERSFDLAPGRVIDNAQNSMIPTQLHSVQIIPSATKRLDLFLMGSLSNGRPSVWIKGSPDTVISNPQKGTFFYANSSYALLFPITSMESFDLFYEAGFFYLNLQDPSQTMMRVAKVSEATWGEVIPSMMVAVKNTDGVSAQFLRNSAGNIVVMDANCDPQNVAVAKNIYSRCALLVK